MTHDDLRSLFTAIELAVKDHNLDPARTVTICAECATAGCWYEDDGAWCGVSRGTSVTLPVWAVVGLQIYANGNLLEPPDTWKRSE